MKMLSIFTLFTSIFYQALFLLISYVITFLLGIFK